MANPSMTAKLVFNYPITNLHIYQILDPPPPVIPRSKGLSRNIPSGPILFAF
jgi:hypothetical protein